MLRVLFAASALLFLPLPLSAQDNEVLESDVQLPVPPAPADHILDEANMFDAPTRDHLKATIARLQAQADTKMYIAAYSFLPGSIDEHARRLREAWSDDARCVVIVYRRGGQQMTFSASGDAETFIPGAELRVMYDTAIIAAKEHENASQRMVAAADTLSINLVRDLHARDANRSGLTPEVIKLIGICALIALGIALIGLSIRGHLRKKEFQRRAGTLFPEVVVQRRLGAPFGGGTVAEIDFAKPTPTGSANQAASAQSRPTNPAVAAPSQG